GGLTGGTYALATMLRLWGGSRFEAAARIGFLAAFPLLVFCPILLTLDLGQRLRFWHMLINTTPGSVGIAFKYWSPISVGSWVLLLYGLFALGSFVEALALEGRLRSPLGRTIARTLSGRTGRAFNVIGTLLGLFVASYTGVLLMVSNQPIWSDTWALGGLFLASGLSGSAALLSWLVWYRGRAEGGVEERLLVADRYFALLELVLIVLFLVSLAGPGTLGRVLAGPRTVLWLLVVASLVPPLTGLGRPGIQVAASRGGTAVAQAVGMPHTAITIGVLAGSFLLRFVVIFSAQF
ncbi:MAG TPA: NrfD/PsrC family molybdoenzyme membrane anchor subunit, partial [bacterium]|nr:NrfD/PsrC family molybdoenzyme membrane anchor subunit [bacterium]